MSKLEDLVPTLELCKQIPAGMFEDSALVHVVYSSDIKKKILSIYVAVRDECYTGPVPPTVWEIYPAPTLQEILEALPKNRKGFYDGKVFEKNGECFFSSDLTDAEQALKFWMFVNAEIGQKDIDKKTR